ncbi:MAG: transcriptional regulator [Halobacteriota archaeon]
MAHSTTRERIADRLRESPASAPTVAGDLELPVSTVYHDLEHVARSIGSDDTDDQFLVAPPACGECGFDRFDDPLNHPSRCPACKSESIEPAVYTIR